MKPQQTGTKKRQKAAGGEAALSLQDELVAAIHGAFEVAVEIAVREVTKLVGQATGGVYEDMRRENESLKKRLQRAEAMLDSVRMEGSGGSSPPTEQLPEANKRSDQPPNVKYDQKSPNFIVGNVHSCTKVRGHSRAHQPPPHSQHDHAELCCGADGQTQGLTDAPESEDGCAAASDALTAEANEQIFQCVLRGKSIDQHSRELADHDSPPLPGGDDGSTLEHVKVKQEETEEEGMDSACCLDSIKMEEFSTECMSTVQSKVLEDWKPELLDDLNQDSNDPLSCTRLAQGSIQICKRGRPSEGSPPTRLPPPRNLRGRAVSRIPPVIRFGPGYHWPRLTDVKHANRCKDSACRRKSKYICMQCDVALCPGCFANFHTR